MPGPDLQTIERVLQSTLPKYVGRKGGKHKLINEAAPRTLFGAEFFNRTKTTFEGGTQWKTKLQFNAADIGQWTGVGEKLAYKGTKAITYAYVPPRFYRWAWYLDKAEVDTQGDPDVVLHDIVMQAKEDADLAVALAINSAMIAKDGNYLHDGTSNYLTMFGLKYWITINGLHITHNTATPLGGITTASQAKWKNPFINPVEASDGGKPITSVFELRNALQRAFKLLNFESVSVWGKLTKNVEHVPSDDPDNKKSLQGSPYGIVVDSGTYDDYRDVVFDRQDNMGADQYALPPTVKGIPVKECESFGMGTYGYGKDDSNNDLWTSAGGSYANGNWANHGECIVYNADYLHCTVHGDHDPAIYDPYKPEGMEGVAYEGSLWVQTACRSRRRAGAYIGPYRLARAVA